MISRLIQLVLFGLLLQNVKAQECRHPLLKPPINISFSEDGKLIEFPPTIVSINSEFHFSVKVPIASINQQKGDLLYLLKKTKDSLQSDEIQKAYKCLFGDQKFQEFTTELTVAINELGKKTICEVDTSKLTDKYIPVKKFIRYIYNNQFEVRIYSGNTVIEKTSLNPGIIDCNNCCINYQSTCKSLELCRACLPGRIDELSYQFIRRDPLNKTLMEWYNEKSNDLSSQKNAVKEKIEDNLKKLANESDCGQYTSALNALKVLNEWWLGWLWYTGGDLTLDPFKILAENQQGLVKKDIEDKNKELSALGELQRFNDSVKAKVKQKPRNIHLFQQLVKRGIAINDEINKVAKERESLQAQLDKGGENAKHLVEATSILYLGKLAITNRNVISDFSNRSVIVQKQFDALHAYAPIYKSSRQRQRVSEIPEDEKVKVLINNINSTDTIKLEEKIQDYNDIEEFTKLAGEELGKIDFSSIPTQSFDNLTNFFKSLASTRNLPKSAAGDSLLMKDNCPCYEIKPFLVKLFNDYRDGLVSYPPVNVVQASITVKSTPKYRTELYDLKDADAPFKDSITFKKIYNKDTTVLGKTIVKVGKLRFIQAAAGLAFTQKPVSTTTIDTTGNGFKVSTSDNKAAAIVGFKFYPFKNYNRDNSIIPRYPLHRLSAFGGFEILHPLNNFYVGASYDIVPGLAISYGENYFLQTRYRVQNNVITNTSRSYEKSGGYYSITVNPTLFIQFVKLLFK